MASCSVEHDSGGVEYELKEAGLPNLWTPSADSFHEMENIPLLGTGKLDLKAVKDRRWKFLAVEKMIQVDVGPAVPDTSLSASGTAGPTLLDALFSCPPNPPT